MRLRLGGAGQLVAEALVDVSGKSRAVEGFGTVAAEAVAGTYMALGSLDEILGNGGSETAYGVDKLLALRYRQYRRDNLCHTFLYSSRGSQQVGPWHCDAMADRGVSEGGGTKSEQQYNSFLKHVFLAFIGPVSGRMYPKIGCKGTIIN